ncbi:hypothetical protein B0T13DRAFT_456420 [Neurospora crassa]|nr:hypothetical protein B0T13DRAFT_456420 [Neurospora crassa]
MRPGRAATVVVVASICIFRCCGRLRRHAQLVTTPNPHWINSVVKNESNQMGQADSEAEQRQCAVQVRAKCSRHFPKSTNMIP